MPAQSLLQFGPYRFDGARGQLWRHDAVVLSRPGPWRCSVSWPGRRGRWSPKSAARHWVARHGGDGVGAHGVYAGLAARPGR